MNNKNILPIVVVAMMVCAVIPAISADVVDSEIGTADTYGEFNFWINYGDGWSASPISGNGYNACIALQDAVASANTTVSFKNINGVSASDFTYTSGYYSTINANYGTIDAIGSTSTSSDKVWHAYYYSDGAWYSAIDAIGFYKPFSDYDANFRTANMAFYYGTAAIDADTITISEGLKDVVIVPTNAGMPNAADFAVTFTIKVQDGISIFGDVCSHVPGSNGEPIDRLKTGVTVTGYGSDAALALDNAMSSIGCEDYAVYTSISSEDDQGNVVLNTASYGYFNQLFGVYENSEDSNNDGKDDKYWYWSLYTGSGSSAAYANYLIGWYSPLGEAPANFAVDTFTIEYTYSAW